MFKKELALKPQELTLQNMIKMEITDLCDSCEISQDVAKNFACKECSCFSRDPQQCNLCQSIYCK